MCCTVECSLIPGTGISSCLDCQSRGACVIPALCTLLCHLVTGHRPPLGPPNPSVTVSSDTAQHSHLAQLVKSLRMSGPPRQHHHLFHLELLQTRPCLTWAVPRHEEEHFRAHLGSPAAAGRAQLSAEQTPSAACWLFCAGPRAQSDAARPPGPGGTGCSQQTRSRHSEAKQE